MVVQQRAVRSIDELLSRIAEVAHHATRNDLGFALEPLQGVPVQAIVVNRHRYFIA